MDRLAKLGELDDQHRQFVAICEACSVRGHMAGYRWVGNGCPPKSRLALCRAFIAKGVWNFASTRDLLDAVRPRPTPIMDPVFRTTCQGVAAVRRALNSALECNPDEFPNRTGDGRTEAGTPNLLEFTHSP